MIRCGYTNFFNDIVFYKLNIQNKGDNEVEISHASKQPNSVKIREKFKLSENLSMVVASDAAAFKLVNDMIGRNKPVSAIALPSLGIPFG